MSIDEIYERYCKKRFPLPSEAAVQDLERRIDVQLPADYRSFLMSHNGGYFADPDIAPPDAKCPTDAIDFLSGIGASHPSAELGGNVDLFDDNDPPQIVPIGYTMMGNLLYVVTAQDGDDYGWICLKLADSSDVFLLGKGMDEFIARVG